jgi:dienelactone hydrolase
VKRRPAASARATPLAAGAVQRELGLETHWSLLSRGDRLHGRTLRPAGADRPPVTILCTPDGSAAHALVARARAAWPGLALAVFDLVLCGSRRSDKLSADALDPSHPLAARLRADLAAQTASDLAAVAALLRADPKLDGGRVSLVGVGLGAELAREFAAGDHGLAAVELERRETLDDAALRALAKKLAGR